MDTALAAVFGTIVGGGISYVLNRQQFNHQLKVLREQYKTDYMAEQAVRHFLEHETHIERSFETLKKSLGGFADDELRRLLVRAGAFRTFRQDGTEWWKLLSRINEFIEKKRATDE